MKKNLKMILSTVILVCVMSSMCFAGSWGKDSQGWWYLNDDGTYASSGWKWIDGNYDGVAECFYFDANGIMLADTTTPDGYTVNKNGAWTQDGEVVQQAAANQVSQSRVWTDGVYSLANAENADYTSTSTLTFQGDKLTTVYTIVGTEYIETYTYVGVSSVDEYPADMFVSDKLNDNNKHLVLYAASNSKIYGKEEGDGVANCWYESVEEHEAYIKDFRKRNEETMKEQMEYMEKMAAKWSEENGGQ